MSNLVKVYNPLFIFLQEHWLPHNEVNILRTDFPGYNFHSTSSDMFIPTEELLLTTGAIWHGTAIGWDIDIDNFVTKLPVVSERFCGISYRDAKSDILSYTLYLPTSGLDEEFLEVLSQLFSDINQHRQQNSVIVIGADTNQSNKSSTRRIEAMQTFCKDFSLKSVLISSEPTFHHNNQTSSSQIDHILYFLPESCEIDLQFYEQLCKLDNSANLSSHDVIIGNLKLPLILTEKTDHDFSDTYQSFIVNKPNWEECGIANYQAQAFKVLSDLFENLKGQNLFLLFLKCVRTHL